jgi:uncharacterized damage-inducible protein DinB
MVKTRLSPQPERKLEERRTLRFFGFPPVVPIPAPLPVVFRLHPCKYRRYAPAGGTFIMNKLIGLAIAISFTLVPLALNAQENPVTTAVRADVAQHAKNLVAGAQEMPEDKYSYAPTPQQMTFGQMVLHVAQSNDFLCSRISGGTAPSAGNLTKDSPKAQLIAAMQASFDYCDQALAKVNDTDLSQEVPFFGGRQVSKASALLSLATDLSDHYAQEAIYLRLNGHLPPTGEGPVMGRGMARPMGSAPGQTKN